MQTLLQMDIPLMEKGEGVIVTLVSVVKHLFSESPFASELKINCNAVWFILVQPPKAALLPSTSSHSLKIYQVSYKPAAELG